MGVKYTRKSAGSLGGADYRAMAHEMVTIIHEELGAAGEIGVTEGVKVINNADTNKYWNPGPWDPRTTGDRIETGEMINAVDYRIFRGASNVGLDVGWPGIYEKYFTYQDQGFDALGFRRSSPSGDHVKGIGMVEHLKFYMRGTVDVAIDRAMKRIIGGL